MPAGELILSSQPFSAFDFTWTNNFGPGIYDLINAGSIGGTFPSTNGAIDGYPATLSTQGNELVLNVVPEPSTLALLGVGTRACSADRGWRKKQGWARHVGWAFHGKPVSSRRLVSSIAAVILATLPGLDDPFVRPDSL